VLTGAVGRGAYPPRTMDLPRTRSRPAPTSRWARTRLVAIAGVLVLGLAACDAGEPEAAPSPTSEPRIQEIRAARGAVAEPAVELARAVGVVVDRTRRLRTEVTEDRGTAAERLLDEPLAALAEATDAVRALELSGGEDVQRASDALDDAAEVADALARAVDEERAEVRDLVEVDAQLAELVAAWEEPGSRRIQMARFDELAVEAEALAEELESRTPLHPCGDVYERRIEAARAVAETTRELRDLVARYRGTEFGERVLELADDPYGTGGATLAELDVEALADCWDEAAEVAAAGERVGGALDALERALAPEDLTGTPTP
jgi:hypothetical protein